MKKLLIVAIIGLLLTSAGYAQETDEGIVFAGGRIVDGKSALTLGIATNPFGGNFWTMTYTNWQLAEQNISARLESFEVEFAYLQPFGKFFLGPLIGADLEQIEQPTKSEVIGYVVASPGFIGAFNAGTWGGLWMYVERDVSFDDGNEFVNRTNFGLGAFFNF